MNVGVIVPAAGSGRRFGGEIPKQYHRLAGVPVIVRAVHMMLAAFEGAPIVVAVDAAWQQAASAMLGPLGNTIAIILGGQTRQESVFRALSYPVLTDVEWVIVHDAVRPLATPQLARRVVEAAQIYGAAVPILPPKDTVKMLAANGCIETTLPRGRLGMAQTPQAFRRELLVEAHAEAARDRFEATDDASIVEYAGYPVATIAGEEHNIKITTQLDWIVAERIIETLMP